MINEQSIDAMTRGRALIFAGVIILKGSLTGWLISLFTGLSIVQGIVCGLLLMLFISVLLNARSGERR